VQLKEFIERYGVSLGVLLALAALVALLPGNATAERVGTGGTGDELASDLGTGGDDTGLETGDGAVDGGLTTDGGATGGTTGGTSGGTTGGTAGGTTGGPAPGGLKFGTGPDCREDGRQKMISRYSPPCVEWTKGTPNGGATFRGVTEDKIVVVRWFGNIDPATTAILQGAQLSDAPDKVKQINDVLLRFSNQHFQTYGREVVFVDYAASGPSENDEAMKRDAINIAAKKPFAVMVANPAAPMPTTLFRDLAQRQILCMCGAGLTEEFYASVPPMLWSSLPSINLYAKQTAEFIGKRMAGKKAQWAGDEETIGQSFKDDTRKFGLIYLEGARGKVDPEGARNRDVMLRELARYGITIDRDVQIGYLYDPGRNSTDVTAMISKLKNEGVTTIIPIWDPLYPILITKEATFQQYFPEWFMTGTGLSDTTSAARLYDQAQWRHAFGISPLWVTWETVGKSTGAREYHHGLPGRPAGDEGVLINIYRAAFQTLFRGIHMAGPNLTNDTWIQGQLAYPKTGGVPSSPLVYLTRQNPMEIKDFTEVFYAANATGPDERGNRGSGMVMKVNGGKRYDLGEWPTTNPGAFDMNGTIAVSDNPPGGADPPHEQDGHTHNTRCLSCG
jgi:hypothetical protein